MDISKIIRAAILDGDLDQESGEMVQELATQMMDEFLLIIEENPTVKGMGETEYKFLIALILDGFNDSTDE